MEPPFKGSSFRPTGVENRLVVAKGDGVEEGWIGSLGLADANYYM